jgi:hypothetical protein
MTVVKLPDLELLFSSGTKSEEEVVDGDKLIWKDILREGDFAITPGYGKRVPFKVITDGESSPTDRIVSMSDLEKSHEAQAFEHVPIPLVNPDNSHPDAQQEMLNNTGYVYKLRRKIKDGVTYLQAGMGFTEAEIKGKVKNGSIPNVSSGIHFNHLRKADGVNFPAVLKHVVLTPRPVINKLEPFKAILASDEGSDSDIELYQFADTDDESAKTVEVVWDEKDGSNWLRSKLQEALSPDEPEIADGRPRTPIASYYVEDVAPAKKLALVQEYFRGDTNKFLIPFEQKDESVEPAPNIRWTQVREAMIAASDDLDPFEAAAKNKSFEDMSSDKIREKLGLTLSEILGKEHPYEVSEIAVDNRCKIVNKENKAEFIAEFSSIDNGDRLFIAASSQWEQVAAPQKPKEKDKQILASEAPDVSFVEDTPEARVMAARERRRRMMLNK